LRREVEWYGKTLDMWLYHNTPEAIARGIAQSLGSEDGAALMACLDAQRRQRPAPPG